MYLMKDRRINNHGLDETCESYIGKLLKVCPIYGWGWGGNEEEPLPPSAFDICLERLWWWGNERRGGIGTIKENNNKYNGWKVIFNTRHTGIYNFTDKIGHYNIVITNSEIKEKEGQPLPKQKVKGSCYGFCTIEAKDITQQK